MNVSDKTHNRLGLSDLKAIQIPTFSAVMQLITFGFPMLVLLAMAMLHIRYGMNITYMTRDIAVIAKVSPLAGFLSNFGAFLWCTTAAICLFTAMILHRLNKTDLVRFFIFSGLLSAYLLFDDFFMFHEELGPRYLGLNEKVIVGLLGLCVLVYLVYFQRVILCRTNWLFLFLALAFLSTSAGIDTILYRGLEARIGFDWAFFLEDGAKWLGIASWCSYYTQTAYQALISAANPG